MNILFISLVKISSLEEHNLYPDLLRALIKKGHNVYAVCPSERRNKEQTNLKLYGTSAVLTVKTLNIQKTSIVEKGIGTLLIKRQFIRAIKKWIGSNKFDLILYPTPPITFYGVVKHFKKRDNAKTYLLLKDIFPQNAVDLGMMRKKGIKSLIYKYFRRLEKQLYKVSDHIGCMSPANVDYLLNHNPQIDKKVVEVFPNCIEVQDFTLSNEDKKKMRTKYNLPLDKKIFVYGGNLGKPQCVPFVIECLKTQTDNPDVYFLIVGDGTDYHLLEEYHKNSNQSNFTLLNRLDKNDFDKLLSACDVGMIFLDYKFTIPNFPSRFLSYLQAGIPVLACTDKNTDIGEVIEDNKLGWWCESNSVDSFVSAMRRNMEFDKDVIIDFLKKNYSVDEVLKSESFKLFE